MTLVTSPWNIGYSLVKLHENISPVWLTTQINEPWGYDVSSATQDVISTCKAYMWVTPDAGPWELEAREIFRAKCQVERGWSSKKITKSETRLRIYVIRWYRIKAMTRKDDELVKKPKRLPPDWTASCSGKFSDVVCVYTVKTFVFLHDNS